MIIGKLNSWSFEFNVWEGYSTKVNPGNAQKLNYDKSNWH